MPKTRKTNKEKFIDASIDYFESFDDITAWQERFAGNMSELCSAIDENIDGYEKTIDKLNDILDRSTKLHQKDGQCYKLTEKIFENYSYWAYLSKVRNIVFERAGFFDNGENNADVDYKPQPVDTHSDEFMLARADIYDLIDDAETGDYSCRAINNYMHSVKLPLQATLVYLMDRTVHILMKGPNATPNTQKLGKFLKNRYMTLTEPPEEFSEFMKMTGSKTRWEYYSTLEKAISAASSIIFGFVPVSGMEPINKSNRNMINDVKLEVLEGGLEKDKENQA